MIAHKTSFGAILLVIAVSLLGTAPADAQIQASPHGMVAQTIDGTTITIGYGRPSVRGREVFGGIVPWGVVWTPGANWATTLETTNDIWLNGVAVPAGDYSVWVVPREDEWLVMLNDEPEIFHFVKPDSSQASIHFTATPEAGPHTEMLTWAISEVRGDFGKLALHWAETVLPIEVQVPASRPSMTEDEMAMYVGNYEMTVVPADPSWPEEATVEVFIEDGMLRGRMSFTIHPVDDEVFDLIPAGGPRFLPGLYHDGDFFNVERGVGFDFILGMDRAE